MEYLYASLAGMLGLAATAVAFPRARPMLLWLAVIAAIAISFAAVLVGAVVIGALWLWLSSGEFTLG